MNQYHLSFLRAMDELDRAQMFQSIIRHAPWPDFEGVELDPIALIVYLITEMAEDPTCMGAKVVAGALGHISARLDRASAIIKTGLREAPVETVTDYTQGFTTGQRTLALEIGMALGMGRTMEDILGATETETQAA